MAQESKRQESKKVVRLKVMANLLESKGAEKLPKGFAYAFSAGGRLLSREALDDKGTATLSFAASEGARSVRVMVGPKIEEKEALIPHLQRRGAEERLLRIDPGHLTPAVEISVIPDIWRCWLLGLCFVRGTLLKRAVSGGVNIDLPVCNATVEVYEVDPIWIIIPRLPDHIIERIRDVIINPPIPSPPPPSPPPDGPIGPFAPPLPPGPWPELRSLAMVSPAGSVAGSLAEGQALQTSSAVAELQFLARTTNTVQFRQVLIDRAAIIRPILCLFFPPFVTTQLVATATTDECGHFQTFFFRGCNNPDTPDLYFKAKQRLFGFFNITIYAPTPIPCFTYWNYVCGTEVTLHTTHPLAVTCPRCPPVIAPNNWVLVMAVGNYPLSRIHGTSKQFYDDGLTNLANLGLTQEGEPFGRLLRLRLEFDNSLRGDLGVKYYRVSWRKGSAGNFTHLNGECHRHYTHEVGGDLVIELYPLGPFTVGSEANLFEIPPDLPPTGQWSFPDLLEDLTNAKLPSHTLAPSMTVDTNGNYSGTDSSGEYQLKVDLFDAAGNLVNIEAPGMGIKYRVPKSTDLSGTIETEDAAAAPLNLVVDDDGDGKKSFIMTLHVDNNVCFAGIAAPTIGGTAADPCCGVLHYQPGDSVQMDWQVKHPHGFATYTFRVIRGVNTVLEQIDQPVGSGSFSITRTVADLMSTNLPPGCDPCTVAGFSENLDLQAMMTDGWQHFHDSNFFTSIDTSRAFGYEPRPVRAFVLAPQPPPE